MAEQLHARTPCFPLLLQKKSNQLLDLHDRNDPKKQTDRRTTSLPNSKNGANYDRNHIQARPSREDDEEAPIRIDEDLVLLKKQIESLEAYDPPELRLRLESEAFILHKRRT